MSYNLFLKQDICKKWLATQIDSGEHVLISIILSRFMNEYTCVVCLVRRIEIDRAKLEAQVLARFNFIIHLQFKTVDREQYPVECLISGFVRNSANSLPRYIVQRVMRLSEKLKTVDNLNGYIITIAGKLGGPKHSRKKFVYGVNKYTGSYLAGCSLLKTIAINTAQGVVGIQLRVIYNKAIPGRFKLKHG